MTATAARRRLRVESIDVDWLNVKNKAPSTSQIRPKIVSMIFVVRKVAVAAGRGLRRLHFDRELDHSINQWVRSRHGKDVLKEAVDIIPRERANTCGGMADYTRSLFSSSGSEWDRPQECVLSQLLTFPLTMANGIRSIFPFQDDLVHMESLNVTVVGARAESSLPAHWWRHALFLNPPANKLSIRFVGPGIGVNTSFGRKFEHSCSWREAGSGQTFELHLRADVQKDATVLHQHSERDSILATTHVFVLYNPGIGSKTLRDSWAPTLELLLSARKPVLCTALSGTDLRNDIAALSDVALKASDCTEDLGDSFEMICEPQINAFSSSYVKLDEAGSPIASNHSFYVFQPK